MCTRELPVPRDTAKQIKLIKDHNLRNLARMCTKAEPKDRPEINDVLLALKKGTTCNLL